jgi:hypothetical protein
VVSSAAPQGRGSAPSGIWRPTMWDRISNFIYGAFFIAGAIAFLT